MKILVTGSSGLIGSEAVQHFDAQGHTVVGVDNNMRREFFGPAGDTTWNRERLLRQTRHFRALGLDIRDRALRDTVAAAGSPAQPLAVECADTLMTDPAGRRRLARALIDIAARHGIEVAAKTA